MERCQAENRRRRRRVRPVDATAPAHKLVYVDHVAFQVGEAGALARPPYQIYASAHVPYMMPGGDVYFDTNTSPYVWRLSPSDSQLGVAMALSKALGYTQAARAFSRTKWPRRSAR